MVLMTRLPPGAHRPTKLVMPLLIGAASPPLLSEAGMGV